MRRFLALGDSYTIGEGVAAGERWPALLARALNDRGVHLAPPEIIAKTGWTTDELASAIGQAPPTGRFDLVTLLIGVNDQYRGRDVDTFDRGFSLLMQRAIGFAGGDAAGVLAISIPDWGVTPFAEGRDRAVIAREIDAFNAVARERAKRAGASWVDVTDASRAMGVLPPLVTGDGLHPSGEMYARWTELLLPVAAAILER